MKTGIIIQARMSSTRLPGKVMMVLAGHKVLWHVYERCRRSLLADFVVVATSLDASDDAIEKFCMENSIPVFRGSLGDVLSRYYDCAKKFGLDTVVRVTSDCPLIEPTIIDGSIELFRESKVDYVSNALQRTFPRGLDCEVFSFAALERASAAARDPYDRKHVTPYIVKHMSTLAYEVAPEFRANFRLTLDEPMDYELLDKVYREFYRNGSMVRTASVIKYLINHPELAGTNLHIMQKGGKVIVILGGWISKDSDGSWHTDDFYPGFKEHGPSGHKLRLIAGYYLQKENQGAVIVASGSKGKHSHNPDAPTVSSVMKKELRELGVPGELIKEDSESDNTYQQLMRLPETVEGLDPQEVLLVSNAYHLPRIRAFMKHAPGVSEKVASLSVRLVAAEDVVARHDKTMKAVIEKVYASPVMRRHEEVEARGVADLKAGRYKF